MVRIQVSDTDGAEKDIRVTPTPRAKVKELQHICTENELTWEEKCLLVRGLGSLWGISTEATEHKASTSTVTRRKLAKAKQLDMSLNKANSSKTAPSWSASSWLSSLMLVQTLSAALLDQTVDTDSEESAKIKGLTRSQIRQAVDMASLQIKELLYSEVEKLQRTDGQVLDASALSDKFAASGDSFTFTYGSMDIYHGGLEALIGAPNPNIMQQLAYEHTQSWYAKIQFRVLVLGPQKRTEHDRVY
jgi:hypothetical protein